MILAFYLICHLLFVLIGSRRFGGLFNPVTVFSFVWAFSVTLYCMKLVAYHELRPGTWAVLFTTAWAFFIGCMVAGKLDAKAAPRSPASVGELSSTRLTVVIVVLTTVASIAIIPNFMDAIARYGTALTAASADVYADREAGDMQRVSYFSPIIYSALIFVGFYVKTVRFRPLLIIPLVLAGMNALSFGGRNSIMLALLCFLLPTLIWPGQRAKLRLRVKLMAAAAVGALGGLFIAVNSSLSAAFTVPDSTSTTLAELSEIDPGFYRAYTYLTVPIGVLNEYFRDPFFLFGANSFLPLYGQLNKIGYEIPLLEVLPSYFVPIEGNVGTFLMDFWIDFGPVGAVFAVFLVGLLASVTFVRCRTHGCLFSLVISTIGMLCVALSFFMWYFRSINLVLAAGAALIAAAWLNAARRKAGRRNGKNSDTLTSSSDALTTSDDTVATS